MSCAISRTRGEKGQSRSGASIPSRRGPRAPPSAGIPPPTRPRKASGSPRGAPRQMQPRPARENHREIQPDRRKRRLEEMLEDIQGRVERRSEANEHQVGKQNHRQIRRQIPFVPVSAEPARSAKQRHRHRHYAAGHDEQPAGDFVEQHIGARTTVLVQFLLHGRQKGRCDAMPRSRPSTR